MRFRRRVIEMGHAELAAVLAVVLPGRKVNELPKDEMQEMCLKWLFANGLSINHEFMLDTDEDGELFVIMSNRQACKCCKKEDDTASVASFDKSPYSSRLAVFHPGGDGTVTLSVPGTHRDFPSGCDPPIIAYLLPSAAFQKPVRLRPYSWCMDGFRAGEITLSALDLERRNSSSATADIINNNLTEDNDKRYKRTKSESQVLNPSRLRPVNLDEPPNYAPPPPPKVASDRALNERRGQKVSPIRTQPLPVNHRTGKPVNGMNGTTNQRTPNVQKKKEADKGFFKSCYREFGNCCMGLCSNFSL